MSLLLYLNCLWNCQRVLVYPPAYFDIPEVPYRPEMFDVPSTNITLMTKDSVELECYLIKSSTEEEVKRSRGTLIMFHGNAMSKSSLLPYASYAFFAHFNVLAVEYRGYHGNEGSPSEKGLRLDAQAALNYVLADPILSTKPVISFGQSMGGAVAIDLASQNTSKISALIVENTFTSIPDLISGRVPWFLKFVRYFCTQRWNSRGKIVTLPSSFPILMLSGLMDEVVPPSAMERLWNAAQTRHTKRGRWEAIQRLMVKICQRDGGKRSETDVREQQSNPSNKDEFFTFEYGEHVNTCDMPGYVEAFHGFLNKVFPDEFDRDSNVNSDE